MHIAKVIRFSYLIVLVFVFNLTNVNAQIRNTDTISYYVINPYGNMAEITWSVFGGTIAGHSTPYTAEGADTIQVIWNNSNKTSANYGSLHVSEIIHWPGGPSCPSEEEQINVESWVQPTATTDTSGIIVCRGETFMITINFEGKPGYQYKWKLYDSENPELLIENHTTEFINSSEPSADILIAGLENNGSTQKLYEFEVTEVLDALNDSVPGNVSMAGVTIYVQPEPIAGTLKSSDQLIRR